MPPQSSATIHLPFWRNKPRLEYPDGIVLVETVREEVEHSECLLPVCWVPFQICLIVPAETPERPRLQRLVIAPPCLAGQHHVVHVAVVETDSVLVQHRSRVTLICRPPVAEVSVTDP